MDGYLHFASGLVAAGAVAPFLRLPHWWVRVFDFPRAQALALGLAILGLDLWFLDLSNPLSRLATIALALGVAVELSRVLPYTPLHRVELLDASAPAPRNRISLLTCNVLQDNRDARPLLDLIARTNPDIVFLVEVDAWWVSATHSLAESYPYRLSRPQDDGYGMTLYSRFELIDPEVRFVRVDHIPSVKTTVQLPSGRAVRLYGLHPAPPAPRYAETTSQRDAELVLVGREAKAFDGPVIVMGDLNDVAWSHTTRLFRRISGLLDPRVGRRTMSTFPVAVPLLRFPLDHIFVSNHFKLVEFKRLQDVGSDHFPVWAALQLEALAEVEQPEPQPEGDDRAEVREIVAEADEELRDDPSGAADTIPGPLLDPAHVRRGS